MDVSNPAAVIEDSGIIAIIRSDSPDQLMRVAGSIMDGGIKVIEFPMTSPNALKIIEDMSLEFGNDILLGAGTVLDPETARSAILAGAKFIVTPTINSSVIEICHRYSITVIPGGFTATEALRAWELGADFVKIFPAGIVGPKYISALRGPFPQIKLIAVGNISSETVGSYLSHGASAVGIGGSLFSKSDILECRWGEIKKKSENILKSITQSRSL